MTIIYGRYSDLNTCDQFNTCVKTGIEVHIGISRDGECPVDESETTTLSYTQIIVHFLRKGLNNWMPVMSEWDELKYTTGSQKWPRHVDKI
jgi:hypothetical protein